MTKTATEKLKDVLNVQCANGNWNYDPYMHGLANGLIMAASLLDDVEPKFLKAPDVWLKDEPQAVGGPELRHGQAEGK